MRKRSLAAFLVLPAAVLLACGEGAQQETAGEAKTEEEAAGQAAAEQEGEAGGAGAGASVALVPKNESGIHGTAMLSRAGDSVRVELEVAGVDSGESYPAHVHQGTCQTGGGVAAGLNDVSAADSTGSSATALAAGDLDMEERYFVQVHLPDGTPAACGDVPTETSGPSGSGAGGGSSGGSGGA